MIVQEYIAEGGANRFRDWFDRLDPQAAAKVTTGLLRLELGNVSNVKWIGSGLGEYRIDWGPGYRLYLMREGDELIILFAGGTKKRQQADIESARAMMDEYKARKAAAKRMMQ
jgi:putative addiction module killer protein